MGGGYQLKRKLLIATESSADIEGLSAAFADLEEIELLAPNGDCDAIIAAVQAGEVDILLMDLLLEHGDGIVVLEAIQAMEERRRSMTFLITAFTNERLLYNLRDKIDFCFAKPLVYERVALRVLQFLQPVETPDLARLQERSLSMSISEALLKLGIPAHLQGYYYLRDAIHMYASTEMPLKLRITADVYPAIADYYAVTPLVVENAMRNAVEYAWTYGNLEEIQHYFGYTVNEKHGKPGNAEFVMLMAEHLREDPVPCCDEHMH